MTTTELRAPGFVIVNVKTGEYVGLQEDDPVFLFPLVSPCKATVFFGKAQAQRVLSSLPIRFRKNCTILQAGMSVTYDHEGKPSVVGDHGLVH